MISLSLRFIKNFKIEINCADNDILASFMTYLRTEKTSTRLIEMYGRKILKSQTTEVKLYRKNKQKLTLNMGLADYLAFHISSLCKEHEIDLDFKRPKVNPVILSEKWQEIFSHHPKGKERGDMQVSDFKKLAHTNTGIAELFTGYGKTELLLSLAECVNQRTVILVPNNDIRDEVLSRAKTYNVDLGNYDWSKQINVINVVGFMKSKAFNDQSREWLKAVKVALSDECHHASSLSYQLFYDLLPDLERSHGFSASTDVAEGKKVIANTIDIRTLGPNTAKVVSLCGPVRVTRTSKVPVILNLVKTHVADKDSIALFEDWSRQLDQTLINHKMSKVISRIFEIDRSRVFFIAVHKKEPSEVLYFNLIEAGYKGILWTADNYVVNGERIKVSNILVDLKKRMSSESFDFVMSTKLEGFDIPKLNAAIPLVGANYRMVVQPIGRSARNIDVQIYLILDMNNRITVSQARTRLEKIEAEYNIVSRQTIRIEP